MVLTQKFREQLREEGREEGREAGIEVGRELERMAWVEWNERRTRAMEEGREFSEPPPNGK